MFYNNANALDVLYYQQTSQNPEIPIGNRPFKMHHDLTLAIYRDDSQEMQRLFDLCHDQDLDLEFILFRLNGDDIEQSGDTLLHRAARMGRTQSTQYLLKLYLKIKNNEIKSTSLPAVMAKLLNRRGETILHAAAAAGKPHVIETIFQTLYNFQPLMSSSEKLNKLARRRSNSITRSGVDLDDFINAKSDHIEQRTALHLTCTEENRSPNAINYNYNFASSACFGGCPNGSAVRTSGYAQAADLLLHHGASVDETDLHGLNAFHLACLNGQLELAKQLCSAEPGLVNQVTEDGWSRTPLHVTIQQAALIAQNTATPSTSTSMNLQFRGAKQQDQHVEHLQRHLDIVSWLLQNGADRNKRDAAGRLPQHTLLIGDSARQEKKELAKGLARLGLVQ